MTTKKLYIAEENPNMELLQEAANMIKQGGLVVFPTETVYGLGAAATQEEAVKGIFQAKGRPSDNPLIVHVANREMMLDLVESSAWLEKPEIVKLMDAFWPGPLTIIFPKHPMLSDGVTAGLSTVGIRMPNNVVARELIRLAGVGIAAPSANTSGKPSPTTAEHVIEDMDGKVDAILCAAPCTVGVESTVLDMTVEPPVILRPGGVTKEQLEEVLGKKVLMAKDVKPAEQQDFVPRAPGMKYRHYAPKGKVIVFSGAEDAVITEICKRVQQCFSNGERCAVLASVQTASCYPQERTLVLGDRTKPETFAATLFHALRQCDTMDAEYIFAEAISDTGIGAAVMNRLMKAAGHTLVSLPVEGRGDSE